MGDLNSLRVAPDVKIMEEIIKGYERIFWIKIMVVWPLITFIAQNFYLVVAITLVTLAVYW